MAVPGSTMFSLDSATVSVTTADSSFTASTGISSRISSFIGSASTVGTAACFPSGCIVFARRLFSLKDKPAAG